MTAVWLGAAWTAVTGTGLGLRRVRGGTLSIEAGPSPPWWPWLSSRWLRSWRSTQGRHQDHSGELPARRLGGPWPGGRDRHARPPAGHLGRDRDGPDALGPGQHQQPRNRGRHGHHRHRRTPAAVAGLAPGDVIVSLGGHAVTSAAGLRPAIDGYHPGNKTSVVWADLAGQTHTATVVFATSPAG